MGFSDTEFHRMEYEEGQRLISMYRHEEINREIMDVSLKGMDPMKVEKYRKYLDQNKPAESEDGIGDVESLKKISEYLKNG